MNKYSEDFTASQMHGDGISLRPFQLIREMPLRVLVDGHHVSTVFRTPGMENALAAGICVGAGILSNLVDLKEISWKPESNPEIIELHTTEQSIEKASHFSSPENKVRPDDALSDAQTADLLCNDLDAFENGPSVSWESLHGAPKCMKAIQRIHYRTRSAHAVIVFDQCMGIIASAEDVGRHNALDKAIGQAFLSGKLPQVDFVLLSCRINREVVEKCSHAKIPTLVSISRPTTLAVHMAKRLNMTIALSTNDEGLFVFSGGDRLK